MLKLLIRGRIPAVCGICFLLIAIIICDIVFPFTGGGISAKPSGIIADTLNSGEGELAAVLAAAPAPILRIAPLAIELEAASAGVSAIKLPVQTRLSQPKALIKPSGSEEPEAPSEPEAPKNLETLKAPQAIRPPRPAKYETDGFSYSGEIPLSRELQEYTYGRSELLGLEYEMVLAIMWRESLFKHDVVGNNSNGTRDSGLMQINDINRGWLKEKHGIENLLDPYQNIDAGTIILLGYFSKYDETRALLCYQYGEQGMLRRWEAGMRTNKLTLLVQSKRDEFRALTAV